MKSPKRAHDKTDVAGAKCDVAGKVIKVKTNVRVGGIIRETTQYLKYAWAETGDFLRTTWMWLW